MDAGNVATVGEHAEQLRLRITEDERSIVLDYIAQQKMVAVNIDIVETAITNCWAGTGASSCDPRRRIGFMPVLLFSLSGLGWGIQMEIRASQAIA